VYFNEKGAVRHIHIHAKRARRGRKTEIETDTYRYRDMVIKREVARERPTQLLFETNMLYDML
jgi:hypothetical protein